MNIAKKVINYNKFKIKLIKYVSATVIIRYFT